MEGRAVLGVRRAVNMLVAQVRKGYAGGSADGASGEPECEENEDDEHGYRLPRTGRVAIWGNALKSDCRECR
eukprot:377583-Lingulodinium_polyedra.AAC.1